jgi:DNA-binding HxlR family transcriptional regulator
LKEVFVLKKTCVPSGMDLKDTGFGYTLSLIAGKYKIIIIYWLAEKKIMRHNELKRSIGNIPFKTLSIMLKELEAEDLITRKEYPQIPPKVEYSLTERGLSLLPLLNMMCDWGEANRLPALQRKQQ